MLHERLLTHSLLRRFLYVFIALIAVAEPSFSQSVPDVGILKPRAQTIEELNRNYCKEAVPKYNEIHAWIKAHTRKHDDTQIPVPPSILPDCYECGTTQNDLASGKIASWLTHDVYEPEGSMIRSLLEIARAAELLTGSEISALDCKDGVSTQGCLDDVKELMMHIRDAKVIPMSRKYHKIPEMAPAGVIALLATSRQCQLLGMPEDDATSLAAEWLHSLNDHFTDRVTKLYQYRLFSVYPGLQRQLALLGDDRSTEDMVEVLKKLSAFMHFQLKVNFEAEGHGKHGERMHAAVEGLAELTCRVTSDETANMGYEDPDLPVWARPTKPTCFTWHGVEGDFLKCHVNEAIFQSDNGAAVYEGPLDFDAPFKLSVSMCNDNPKFTLTLDDFGDPNETYTTSDGPISVRLLQSLAMATLGSHNLEPAKQKAEELKSEAQSLERDPEYRATILRLQQHKKDTAYFRSKQGMADIAMAQSVGARFGGKMREPKSIEVNKSKLKEMSDIAKRMGEKHADSAYLMSGGMQRDLARYNELSKSQGIQQAEHEASATAADMIGLMNIELPWQNGTPTPVSGDVQDKVKQVATSSDGAWDYGKFTVTVTQMTDKNDVP